MVSAVPAAVHPAFSPRRAIITIPMPTAAPWEKAFVMIEFFQGVAKGMAKVQQRPFAGIKLIVLDHLAFNIDTTVNHIVHNWLEIFRMGEQVEQCPAFDASILDDFSHAICKEVWRKGLERIRIDQNEEGCQNAPTKFFSLW